MQNKLVAEALGTFTLTLAVIATLNTGLPIIPTPLVAALIVALFVYTVGPICGAHFNPAVTLGLWSIKQIRTNDALAYIAVQVVSAIVAFMVASTLINSTLSLGFAPESLQTFVAELIGASLFGFGIAAVVHGKIMEMLSGIIIGWSLLLGIVIASALGSLGILNPAIAFALGTLNLSYALGAILGAVIGMNLYRKIIL